MRKFLLAILFILPISIYCQLEGTWQVSSVSAGDRSMTPQARWSKFYSDGTFVGGNGWLQHSYGTYSLDGDKLSLDTKNEPADSNGPFTIKVKGQSMEWTREEEGMMLKVILTKIEDLPMAPADQMKGLWNVDKVMEKGQNITEKYDPNDNRYLFVRWDRIFVMDNTPSGRLTGYWHTDGHRPEVTFLYHDTSNPVESFTITMEGKNLILKSDTKEIELSPRSTF